MNRTKQHKQSQILNPTLPHTYAHTHQIVHIIKPSSLCFKNSLFGQYKMTRIQMLDEKALTSIQRREMMAFDYSWWGPAILCWLSLTRFATFSSCFKFSWYPAQYPSTMYGRPFSAQKSRTSIEHFPRLQRGIVGKRWCSIWKFNPPHNQSMKGLDSMFLVVIICRKAKLFSNRLCAE